MCKYLVIKKKKKKNVQVKKLLQWQDSSMNNKDTLWGVMARRRGTDRV